jgi:hypothetical protein
MSQRRRPLRQLFLYCGAGSALLALLWVAPLTRRLAAGLVRLAIVVSAPLLSNATERDPAVPTWMFVLCVGIASAFLGLMFFAIGALWRASRKSSR